MSNPAIYLRGVKNEDVKNIVEFMYIGEVSVAHEDLDSFLSVAQDLSIKGLTQQGADNKPSQPKKHSASTPVSNLPPPAKRAKFSKNGSSEGKRSPVVKNEANETPPVEVGQVVDNDVDESHLETYEDHYYDDGAASLSASINPDDLKGEIFVIESDIGWIFDGLPFTSFW